MNTPVSKSKLNRGKETRGLRLITLESLTWSFSCYGRVTKGIQDSWKITMDASYFRIELKLSKSALFDNVNSFEKKGELSMNNWENE